MSIVNRDGLYGFIDRLHVNFDIMVICIYLLFCLFCFYLFIYFYATRIGYRHTRASRKLLYQPQRDSNQVPRALRQPSHQ